MAVLAARFAPDELLHGTNTGKPPPPIIYLRSLQKIQVTLYYFVQAQPEAAPAARTGGARLPQSAQVLSVRTYALFRFDCGCGFATKSVVQMLCACIATP